MIVAEYLARCMQERDYEWAIAEVENIPTHTWMGADSTLVIDSIEIHLGRWESSDDVLMFTIYGHNAHSSFRENWQVRPSLTRGIKAECTEDSVSEEWIADCLLNYLRSTKQ